MILREPRGAGRNTMAGGDYQGIFSAAAGQFSECESWILDQGTDSCNPLRVLEDDEDEDDD